MWPDRKWSPAFLAFALFLFPALGRAETLPRVASIELCGDQFLLMLAEKEQIVSLSRHALSELSFYAAEARAFPQNHGAAEELINGDVDLVVMGEYGNLELKRILARFGVATFELPLSEEIEEVEETVLSLAKAIGQTERGQEVVADMRKRLQAAAHEGDGSRPYALYFRSDGGGAGARTFVNSALEHAGYRNLQTELGPGGWGTFPFERVVMSPPDLFVTSFFDTPYSSVRAMFRYNPAFWSAAEGKQVIQVPGKLWPCASPLLVNAVEYLVAEKRQVPLAPSGEGR